MKTHIHLFTALAFVLSGACNLRAQGNTFTCQGRLNDCTNAAKGSCDLTFARFDVSSGAGQVGGTQRNLATGLYTANLASDAGVFAGANRWLEVAVCINGGGPLFVFPPPPAAAAPPCTVAAAGLCGTKGTRSRATGRVFGWDCTNTTPFPPSRKSLIDVNATTCKPAYASCKPVHARTVGKCVGW